MLTNDFLDILACPACKGELKTVENRQKLICRFCGITLPVRNGIPVMLADKAIPGDKSFETNKD